MAAGERTREKAAVEGEKDLRTTRTPRRPATFVKELLANGGAALAALACSRPARNPFVAFNSMGAGSLARPAIVMIGGSFLQEAIFSGDYLCLTLG